MTLNLVRRSTKGSPLTATDHDGNLNKLEDAIESIDPADFATAAQGAKADTAIQPGNAALTDARTPTSHATSHATGGSDAINPAAIGAATAAQGALAATAVQPAALTSALAGKVDGTDARLTDAREWTASTIGQAEAEEGTGTTRRAFTALRVFQAAAAWWAGSAAASKLAGIAPGATVNAADAQLRDRSTHTGTQAASTISDSTAAGRALLTAADAAAQRTSLGLGTAATTDTSAYATAAQGSKADTAIQPSDARLSDSRTPTAHTQAASTITGLGGAALLNVGTGTGTVAAGDDSRFAELKARLDSFRDASTFYVSKRISASDSNNGTSLGEAFLTIGAAVAAANAYVVANPGALAKIDVGPGRFTETSLPFRLKPGILAQGAMQRGTIIEPAAGQELNGFWALDSGCMIADFRFSGHQATGTSSTNSTVGTRAWAVRLNEQANNGAGVYLTASPYVKDCASITAEADAGQAGSISTGDTGGGVLVDGAACQAGSPIRSMIVYGFTQQNLGGPGAVIRNDAYAELVSFFGLFGTWHVQCETGGQATLSGGGCSEFGIYGLVADGYSPTALYTGSLRVAASAGTLTADVIGMSANRLGSSSRPAAGQIMLLGGGAYVVQSSVPITSDGVVVADDAPTRAGYRVNFYNPTAVGLAANVAQGATADFRQRSQISAGCHSANYVGSGTNYSALPWNGGVPVRGNEAVERNFGRVFGLIVNDVGDVKVAGGAFAVDGTTGAVTISTSSFNLSGLNAIGPFSRNGGVSTVGNQLQELSNSSALLASTGSADGNTAPTQFAVKSYTDNRFLAGLTTTEGQPISVSDTSTQDGLGFWTRTRNLSLSLNSANGLAQLNNSSLLPASLLPAATTSAAGAMSAADKVRLDGMATGATANATDAQLRDRSTHTGTQAASTITGLAAVATSGTYSSLSDLPDLGLKADLVGGVIPSSQIPAIAISEYLGTVASQTAMLALSGQRGDWAIRSDRQRAWILSGDDASLIGSWVELPTPVDAITSVNNQTGVVVLGAADVGAATAAQGAKADTAIQPGNAALSDAREWSAATIDQAEAEAGTATTRRAFTAQRVFQSVAAWWAASAAKTKLDGIASGATANSSDATLLARANHTGTQAASTISGLSAVATSGSASDLGSGTLPAGRLPATGVRFDQVGLGTAAVSGWDLVIADSLCQRRVSVTAVSSTYTLDVQVGNEFITAAAIAGATTINLSNLANIPTGYLWRGVLTFSYTSGTISWFTGNTGYTVKWDGGSAMTPTASEVEKVVIEVVGGATTIEVAPLKGRA